MKAMLLAAGFGERMLPISRIVPKPLIPVLGRPLAPQILSRLAAEGIDEAVINLHHLPRLLRDVFGDGSSLGLRALHYSLEEAQLLGTAGGLAHAAQHLRGAGTILVRNSDFLADIPLAKVVASHRRSGCQATIVLAPHRAGYTPVAIDERHRVVAFGGRADGRYLFTGYQLIEESVLELIPRDAPSDIVRDVYFGLAARGGLNAFVHDGFWWEFGDPRAYLEGSMRLVAFPAEERVRLGDFDVVRPVGHAVAAMGPGVQIGERGLRLTGSLAIGMGVMIGDRVLLEDTVVMPEAWIGSGSKLRRCIVGPGTEIPVDFRAGSALIATDPDLKAPLPAGVERMSGLLVRELLGSGSVTDHLRRGLQVALLRLYPGARCETLPADASTRRFHRLLLRGGGTRIVMDYGAPFDGETDDVRLARIFEQAALPVARVFDIVPEAGALVLEDLGDETLERALGAAGPSGAKRDELYRSAVRLAASIATRGTEALAGSDRASGPALDAERFVFEMNFFLEHYVGGLLRRPDAANALREPVEALALAVAAHPRVLCHRDFHSRNIMVRPEGALAMVDIQDARWGPDTYDLASLLRDAYVDLGEAEVDELFDLYRGRVQGPADQVALRKRFDLVAAQRMIKALGTFGYQVSVRGRDRYNSAVPRTIDRLSRLLPINTQTSSLADVMRKTGLLSI